MRSIVVACRGDLSGGQSLPRWSAFINIRRVSRGKPLGLTRIYGLLAFFFYVSLRRRKEKKTRKNTILVHTLEAVHIAYALTKSVAALLLCLHNISMSMSRSRKAQKKKTKKMKLQKLQVGVLNMMMKN